MDKSIQNISSKEIIFCIRKYHKLLLGILIMLITSGGIYLYNLPYLSTATAVFYVSNSGLLESKMVFSDEGENKIFAEEEAAGRILNLLSSSQMIDHLIRKFNLYQHYEIDSSDEDSYEQVIDALLSSVKLNMGSNEMSTHGALMLKVSDSDKYFAASMANEIINRIDEINKNTLMEGHKRTLMVYDSYLKNINEKLNNLSDELLPAKEKLESLKKLNGEIWNEQKTTKYSLAYNSAKISFYEQNAKFADTVISNLKAENSGLQSKYSAISNDSAQYSANLPEYVNLEHLSAQLSASGTYFYNEINHTEKLRERTLDAMNIETQLSSLIVLKKAFPQEEQINYSTILMTAIAIGLAFSLTLALLIFWETHRNEIKLLFTPLK